MNFKRALMRIGQELNQHDLGDMKFSCRDVIPEARREHIHSPRDLFQALEERGLLSQDKLDYLVRLLVDIGRSQLLSHLESFGFSVPQQLPPASVSDDSGGGENPQFTKCLLTISKRITSEELDKLVFAWCGPFLMMSPDKIYSANQLFNLMNQRLLIKPDDLHILYIELNEMGRRDLCKVIDDYYELIGSKQRPYNITNTSSTLTPSVAPPVSTFYNNEDVQRRYSGGQEIYFQQYFNGHSRPADLPFSQSPTNLSEHLSEHLSQLHLTYNNSPPQSQSLITLIPEGPPPVPPQLLGSRPSSVNSYSNDGSPTHVQRQWSRANHTFQQQLMQDGEQQLYMRNSMLIQKEQELEELRRQLADERRFREGTTGITQQIESLQNALQLKNTEVERLRNEVQKNIPLHNWAPQITVGELYKMDRDPHGICLIINNYEFYQGDTNLDLLTNRGGANKDQENLLETFRYLRYKVELHENLTSDQMTDALKEISCRDHSAFDSFVCCVLSHGDEGRVFGADSRPVDLRDLTGIMKGTFTKSLMDKPKIFFVQACRGDREDKGIPIEKDGDASLPVEADFLFGYATPNGKAAYRSRRHGSWFISEMCQVFMQDSHRLSLSAMMKKINKKVSDAYTKEGYKQCTEVVDRLRKDVVFFHSPSPPIAIIH